MTLFESILLQENKDRFIKSLTSDEDWKNKAIDFFKSHANLESKINWNKKDKNSLIADISLLMSETSSNKEKNKEKRFVYKNGPKFDKNWRIFKETDDWIFAMPLTWEACKYADSAECGGEGAKWCIGYEKNDEYFTKYVYSDSCSFLMAFNKNYKDKVSPDSPWPLVCTDSLKYMIQIEPPREVSDEVVQNIKVWVQIDDEISTDIDFTTGNWDYYTAGRGYDAEEYDFTKGFWPEITGKELEKAYKIYWDELNSNTPVDIQEISRFCKKLLKKCADYHCPMKMLASRIAYFKTGEDPFCFKSDSVRIIDKNKDRVIFWIGDIDTYKEDLWQNFNGDSDERMLYYEFYEKFCSYIRMGYRVFGVTTTPDLFTLEINQNSVKIEKGTGTYIFKDIMPEGFTFIHGKSSEGYDMDYNSKIGIDLERELNYRNNELTQKLDRIINDRDQF